MPWTKMPMRWYLSTDFLKNDYFGQEISPPQHVVPRKKYFILPLIVLGVS